LKVRVWERGVGETLACGTGACTSVVTAKVLGKVKEEAIVELPGGKLVGFALDNNIILCYDNAYSEITFQDYRAPSVLQIDEAREIAVEFHSCSKTFNMTGSRIGFAVGNERLIEGLRKVKSQTDSGPPKYIQLAAAKALRAYEEENPPKFIKEINQIYYRRAQLLVRELKSLGLECQMPKATFYVWDKCGESSVDFIKKILEVNVVAAPGIGFGKQERGIHQVFTDMSRGENQGGV